MNKLSKEQVLKLHASLIKATGGSDGIRDEGMLDMNCLTAKRSYVMSFLRWLPVKLAKRKFYNGLLSINNNRGGIRVKNYSQVYVKNSIEAAELYCKTFGAEITREFKNETNTAYNVFEMGSEEAVHNAFRILSDGGVIIEPIHELPWSKCCATIIDKYGVCWWISI